MQLLEGEVQWQSAWSACMIIAAPKLDGGSVWTELETGVRSVKKWAEWRERNPESLCISFLLTWLHLRIHLEWRNYHRYFEKHPYFKMRKLGVIENDILCTLWVKLQCWAWCRIGRKFQHSYLPRRLPQPRPSILIFSLQLTIRGGKIAKSSSVSFIRVHCRHQSGVTDWVGKKVLGLCGEDLESIPSPGPHQHYVARAVQSPA